ncbi:hypothetical protein M427DRAFT_57223 [Gonapodya prolifera JEL478]|uniref:Uncharacterized protein n=1 Tax=Gonapodya prolifera (strain JEL478) TaxID=1344416 RepID=A0A139ADI8_GONPJ|nr:hypothetical protein M427DRAFT_57223 [Gonapodya prolifera JEL478]|eukprot:KXS14818.1 hypothetical protein M427DRAFT_57223 [Gonapodya prolifera JEL478]
MDVDGSTVVDLEEDDDVQMMFDSADSIVVIVSGIGSTSEVFLISRVLYLIGCV